MKNKTIPIGIAAMGLVLLCARKRKQQDQPVTVVTETETVRYIPLESIRRGIKELWYKAELTMPNETEYYVILHGLLVDGNEFVQQYPITQATFDALKADGVPVI